MKITINYTINNEPKQTDIEVNDEEWLELSTGGKHKFIQQKAYELAGFSWDYTEHKEPKLTKENNPHFPFEFNHYSYCSEYSISVEPCNPEITGIYTPLFNRNKLTDHGHTWGDIITQILEKEKPQLLQHFIIDPGSDCFYIHNKIEVSAHNKDRMEEFLKTMCPIFNDLEKLEEYIQNADRARLTTAYENLP